MFYSILATTDKEVKMYNCTIGPSSTTSLNVSKHYLYLSYYQLLVNKKKCYPVWFFSLIKLIISVSYCLAKLSKKIQEKSLRV